MVRSVNVVGDIRLRIITSATLVLSDGSLRAGLSDLDHVCLSCSRVLILAVPNLERGGLEGTTEGEADAPRVLDVSNVVHGVEVLAGALLRLATREEGDARDSRRDRSREGAHGVEGNLLGAGLLIALSALKDHVGLDQESLEEKTLLDELLDNGVEHLL